MSGVLPPLATLGPEDRGGAVIAATYTLMFTTVLFCVIRIATTLTLRRTWGGDDLLLLSALSISIAESIIEEKSAYFGLGKHFDSLSVIQKDQYFKFSFTSNILWLTVQALAKTCAVHLMERLITKESRMGWIVCPALHAVVAIWLVLGIFAIAFQCDSPHWVYRPESCASQGALWYPIIIINILTDAAISSIFIPVIWKLQMRKNTKVNVCILFGFRLSVCVVSIVQLVFLAPALTAHDTTWKMVVPEILKQCVMNLSILAAAAPSLHRFLNELHSGAGFGMAVESTPTKLSFSDSSTGNAWGKWASRNKVNSGSKSTTLMDSRERSSDTEQILADGRKVMDFRPDLVARSENVVTSDPEAAERSCESSIGGNEEGVIRQTKAWTVTRYENGNGGYEMSQLASNHHATQLKVPGSVHLRETL